MIIVADRDIPLVQYFFSRLGELRLLDGSEIDHRALAGADLLVVRTVTRVDRALLHGTGVRYVASATSGTDHVDTAFLGSAGIGFASAAGCNARSVAEYVLSSLLAVTEARDEPLAGKRAGIIGFGHVGRLVTAFLQCAGVSCVINDPPLEARSGDEGLATLEEALDADIISVHVPLTREGPWPTLALLDGKRLRQVGERAIIVNTARGGVMDEGALLGFLGRHPDAAAVIDVWHDEPRVDLRLLSAATLATPHIAGYSVDGRMRASETVFRRSAEYLGLGDAARGVTAPSLPELPALALAADLDVEEAMRLAVLSTYDVRGDAAAMRRLLQADAGAVAAEFTALRRDYPPRREFGAHGVRVPAGGGQVGRRLGELGFRVIHG